MSGNTITMSAGKLSVPTIRSSPSSKADGTGRNIWRASVRVFDETVKKYYGAEKKKNRLERSAGPARKLSKAVNNWLPEEPSMR